jgi:hypothetical protein
LLHIHIAGLRQIYGIAERGNSKARIAAVIGMQPPPPVLVSSPPPLLLMMMLLMIHGHLSIHGYLIINMQRGQQRQNVCLPPPKKRRKFTAVFWYGMSNVLRLVT